MRFSPRNAETCKNTLAGNCPYGDDTTGETLNAANLLSAPGTPVNLTAFVRGLTGDDTLTGRQGVDRFVASGGVDVIADIGNSVDELIVLADSGARVRLTLRNPLDGETRTHSQLSLGTVMRSTNETSAQNADR